MIYYEGIIYDKSMILKRKKQKGLKILYINILPRYILIQCMCNSHIRKNAISIIYIYCNKYNIYPLKKHIIL